MLLQRVEAFLAVARTGNVSRAAEELFVTQPALTARLKGLEADLGVELFARTSRGMKLTEAGRAYLPFAQRAVATLRDGKQRLEQLERHEAGNLALAATPGVSTYLLPLVLERFAERHPAIAIAVRTGHSEDVLTMVLREEAQLGIGRALRHPDILSTPLYVDELVLVVHPGHRLVYDGAATLADVAGERLILFDQSSSYYELTRAMFLAAGITVSRTMELDNIEAAKRMVEHGLGVALLPRTSVARDVSEGQLALIPLQGGPPARRPIVAYRRKDAPDSDTAAEFLAIAREVIAGVEG